VSLIFDPAALVESRTDSRLFSLPFRFPSSPSLLASARSRQLVSLDALLSSLPSPVLISVLNRNRWGNNVYAETLDYNGVAYKPLPEEGFFGRSTW